MIKILKNAELSLSLKLMLLITVFPYGSEMNWPFKVLREMNVK